MTGSYQPRPSVSEDDTLNSDDFDDFDFADDDGGDCFECGGEGGYNSCMEDCCMAVGGEEGCTDPICWRICPACKGLGS